MNKLVFSVNIDPFQLFKNITPQEGDIFLDSSFYQEDYGRYSIIVTDPVFTIEYDGKKVVKKEKNKTYEFHEEPLTFLKNFFYKLKDEFFVEDLKNEKTFTSGFVGYFSYDFGLEIERIKSNNKSNVNFPLIFFGFYNSSLVYDHRTKKYIAYSLNNCKEFLDKIFARYNFIKNDLTSTEVEPFKSNFTREEYFEAIRKAKEYIEQGEAYQINLSQQFTSKTNLEPIQIYEKLRSKNPAPFSAFIKLDQDKYVLSTSPELFLDLKNSKVRTKPIKGTIGRGNSPHEDELMKQKLLQSEKDSSELVMIVDLERNDLGKVCQFGTVQVPSLKKLETYASVHHLVAEVEGELQEGKDIFDLISATFPGGSITGAPKKRAMEIIDELEKDRRSIYTGSIGYIDLNGNAMFNIAIRTILYEKGNIFLNLGGGIVYDSNPESEYNETLQKGKAIFEALSES